MTTVTAGNTGSYTLTSPQTVNIAIDGSERARVSILRDGSEIYGALISHDQTIGPFLADDVMSLTAIGGDVVYTIGEKLPPDEDWLNFSASSPEYYSGTDIEKLNAAVAYAALTGGKVHLPAKTYTVANLVVPNNVELEGVSPWVTIIKQSAGAVGPLLTSYPSVGVSTALGGKHSIKNIQFDCDTVGINKTTSSSTATSPTLSSVASFTGLAVGYYVEGVGIPAGTKCLSFDSVAGTVTLDANAVYTTTSNKTVFRPAYAVTATASTLTEVLTVTAGDMSSIVAGMLCDGANLDADADDLAGSSRVASVDYVAQTITLDRVPKTNGSFSLTCYVANDALLIPESFYNPDYNPSKEYRAPKIEGCIFTQASGNGVCCRPGRDQLDICNETKITSNYGLGLKVTAANDSKFYGALGVGTNWKGNISLTTLATPRLENFDCYDCAQPDKYADIRIRGCRQATVSHGDINGWVDIKGKGVDEVSHNIRFSTINFKWHTGSNLPDGTFPQYVKTDAGQFYFDNCYFYGDRTDNACPDYLFDISANATVNIGKSNRIITDVATADRPYKTGIANITAGGVFVGEYLDVTTGFIVRLGELAPRADGSNASSGAIGHTASMKLSSGSAASLTNNTVANLGSITLEPGDWDENCIVHFVLSGATVTKLEVGMPGNSATIPAAPDQHATMALGLAGFTGEISLAVPVFRNNISASATERLNVRATFSAGSVSAYGASFARLRR